jgi:hypothetical protein
MLRGIQLWTVFPLAALLSCGAGAEPCGAHAQDPISTDRPQITASSIVVPCGSLQFENGFEENGNSGTQGFDLPETSIRLGILSRTELRLTTPNYVYRTPEGSGFADGPSDMAIGFKQQLGPTPGKLDVSLIASLSLPTGASAISSHGYDPSLQLPWSRALSKNWTAAGMFSVAWPTQGPRRNATGQASLYFDRQMTQTIDAYVEYSGAFPQRGGPQHIVDFGAAYKVTPHQQLDVHCGFGLSAAAYDHAVGVGYSFRFQAFRYGR